MKTTYLALAALFAGCLNTSQDVYIPENISLSSDTTILAEQVALVQFAATSTHQFTEAGVERSVLFLLASSNPFPCSDGPQDYGNRMIVNLDATEAPFVGAILPIMSFETYLFSEDFSTYFNADIYRTPNPNFEGSLEITALSGSALSGILTARVSGDSVHMGDDDNQTPTEVTFTMTLAEVPDCDSLFSY